MAEVPEAAKKIAVDSPTRGAATGVGKGIAHMDNTMRLRRFTCNEDLYFDMFTKMIKSFSFAFYFIKKTSRKIERSGVYDIAYDYKDAACTKRSVSLLE
ncbi:hypothetical protein [Chryseobacterium taklimakanense]|uniref:Uncharacterized protein n=1 Tax=Chryseobacterium taklimakanense TaxID=536441 RepID=A0A3G8WTN9_9FLAO|nr:hypothetical protein [Chryseobacterium taklimakanense]AZI19741.1 hypothetical protein EIH08_02470 [Chryseobacterium taklimakanense]